MHSIRLVLLLFLVKSGFSQCPSVDFSIASSACINEVKSITAVNYPNGTTLEWDFCDGSLEKTPSSLNTLNTGLFSIAYDVRAAKEGTKIISFVASSGNSKIVKVVFNGSPSATPEITDMGNLGMIFTPQGICLWQTASLKYALVSCNNGQVFLLKFGNSYQNSPTSSLVGGITGLSDLRHIKIIEESGSLMALIAAGSMSKVVVLNFGNSIENSVTVNSISIPSSQYVTGIDVIRYCNKVYALASGYLSGLHLLNFGSSVLNNPSITFLGTVANPLGLHLDSSNGNIIALIAADGEGLVRVDFGASIENPSPTKTVLGNFGFNLPTGLEIINFESHYYSLSVNYQDSKVIALDFPRMCSLQNIAGTQAPSFSYQESGSFNVTLKATDGSGNLMTNTKTIAIANATSPDVDFSFLSACTGTGTQFSSINTSGGIASYSWDFGDGSNSSSQNSIHIYNSEGNFSASLSITGVNGCQNSVVKAINIYTAPTVDFTMPVSVFCTNQNYIFSNISTFDATINPSWEWVLDGIAFSNSRDLVTMFANASGTPQQLQLNLTSNQPGCSSTITKNIPSVSAGPTIDFSFTGICQNSSFQFTNLSSGSISSYSWDFADGSNDSSKNPTHIFSTEGLLNVTLTGNSSNGCQNSSTKLVNVHSVPQPDLYIDIPPFSCSGTPTQFHDATPAPAGSNITSWQWAFNDGTGATSSQQNPTHTFAQSGNYTIDFTASTNFGCSASVQKNVFISPNPSTDFTFGPACLNKPTQFTSSNSQSVNSWQWTIGNSSYTFANPIHTFTSSGNYNAALTVQASNGCESQTTKTITVKPAPVLNFTPTSICEDAPTDFTDATTGADFPISWLWDFGNNNTISSNPASFTFNNAGAFPVSLSVTTVSGCAYSISKNVVVAPAPLASFTATPSVGPPPLNVQFTNTSINSNTVLWEFGDAVSSTSNNINPSFVYTSLGDYLVQLTATSSNGCTNSFNQTIHVIIPSTDLQLLGMSVQQNTTDGSVTPILTVKNNGNLTVTHFDVELSGSSGSRVKPTVSSTLLPSEITEIIVPIQLLTNEKFLCADLSIAEDKDLSNNSWCEDLIDSRIIVQPYPNPASGNIYFEVVLQNSDVGTLSVFSGQGKQVFKQDFQNLSTGMNRIELDLSNYQPGLYLGVWDFQGHRKSFRFLVN